MRVDANVSVNRPGDPFGTRCEIKNLNSLRSLGRAIDYEALRQVDLLEAGERVIQQTRHWDEADGRTHTLRSKEEAEDYRYFAEPDLVPLEPSDDDVRAIDEALPPLPADRRRAVAEAAGVEPSAAAMTVERDLDPLALAAIEAGAAPDRVLTHIDNNLAVDGADRLDPRAFARLIAMETGGELTATQAKTVLADMVETGRGPEELASEHGFEAMDTGELASVVDGLIAEHPDEWASYCDGNQKVAGFFVGAVMKATKGQADGKVVTSLLRERAGS